MPSKADISLLFHPKKKTKQPSQPPSTPPNTGSQTATPNSNPRKRPPAPSEPQDDEEDLKLPTGPFQEFRLLSSALNGWRYDVMKFDSRRPIDVSRWHQPIKLNRKDLKREEMSANAAPVAVAPMLGPDGKPVIGADGKMVMIDAEGRPIQPSTMNGLAGPSKDKDKGKQFGGGKKRFQRKTRQVFFVPDEVRQLRKEERYPWVLEDSNPGQPELWIGQLDDATKAETNAFFMPAANDVFKFVPAHRWYKFQKRLKHDLPTDTANVESLYNLNQKRDPQAWLASRKGKGPSSASASMFKAEAEDQSLSAGPRLNGQSLGPGGRRLKTVDSGMDHLFDDGEDGDEDTQRRRKRELGEEGDLEEQIYEDDFADDEEKMEVDEEDEDAKELEERLKKEYKSANKMRDAGVDESEDEEMPKTTKQAKAMEKLIRNREGNNAYESDDDKNPYASSEEEEEEMPVVSTAGPAIQQQQQEQVESKSQTPTKSAGAAASRPSNLTVPGSRAASPSLSPGGGHSIVAKRATSPKIGKAKTSNGSPGSSPLSGHQTLVPSAKTSVKRKAEELPGMEGVLNNPKAKKRKPPTLSPIAVSSEELEQLLLEWLKNTANATTRDCIHHFTPYLTTPDKKLEFSSMVRKHARLNKQNGSLVIKRQDD